MLFCSCVFQFFFSIACTSIGEERSNLSVFLYVCLICACLVSSTFSSIWCLGRAAVCSGTPWTCFLIFFLRFGTRLPPKKILSLDGLNLCVILVSFDLKALCSSPRGFSRFFFSRSM